MRETHRHGIFWALVIEHLLQPRLGRIERQGVAAPLHRIEDDPDGCDDAHTEFRAPLEGDSGDSP